MERIDLTPDTTRIATLDRGTLHRKLGVLEVFGVAFGDVGSSIIYALGIVTAFALGATPVVIAIAGVFFICTSLTYAELGATIPEAGGAQIFARKAFNDLVSFFAGWALLLDYVLTAAISAYTIGAYLSHFFPIFSQAVWNILFASGVMAVLTALNIHGIRASSRVSLVISGLCVFTFAGIILYGMFTVFDPGKLIGQIHIGTLPTWENFLNGLVMSMVAYIGMEAATQVAGEAHNAGKTVPKALKYVALTVLVLNIGMAVVAMCALPPEELGGAWKEKPLVGIANHLPHVGGALSTWVIALVALVLFVATNAGLIGASRLAYSMSNVLQLPRGFSRLHPRRQTPWISLLFFSLCTVLVLCVTQNMDRLGELYNFGSMLAFALAHLSLIGLRIKKPGMERPYKVPFNLRIAGREIPVTAILGLLVTTATWVAVLILHPTGRNLGFGWMAFGLVLYLMVRRREEIPVVQSVRIERVQMPEYKQWEVKKILVPTLGGANTETVQIACRMAKEMGAEVAAVYVIEIPEALPIETFLADRMAAGDAALARAEAIGRELGVVVHRSLQQARRAADTILELAAERKCDLIVLGAPRGKPSSTVETVQRKSPCRVWICMPESQRP